MAQRDKRIRGPLAVGIERDLFDVDRLAGNGEERVDHLLARETAWFRRGEKSLLGPGGEIFSGRGPLINLGREDPPRELAQIVAVRHEVPRQPREQLRVTRRMTLPIVRRLHEARADEAFPHAIDDHLGEAGVRRRGDERGETLTRVLRVHHQRIERRVISHSRNRRKRPRGRNGLARLERDLDQRLPCLLLEKRFGNGARFWHGDGLALEQCGQ